MTKNISVASLLAVVLHYKPPQKRGIVKRRKHMEQREEKREKEIISLREKRGMTDFNNWEDWVKSWNSSSNLKVLAGHLYCGFNVHATAEQQVNRVCFYFETANGHNSIQNFRKKIIQDEEMIVSEILAEKLQNLSREALKMLHANIFKEYTATDLCYRHSYLGQLLLHNDVLDKIVQFFRPTGIFINNLYWPEKEHVVVKAEQFILKLIEMVFLDETINDEREDELQKWYPDFVWILNNLRKLDFFLGRKFSSLGKKHPSISDALCEIAMNTERHYLNVKRKPKTLEEACYGGSDAAKILILLRIKEAEGKRLQEIYELERQKRETEEKLEELKK